MTPPSRRRTLRAVGLAVAATAGCVDADDPSRDDRTDPPDDDTGTDSPTDATPTRGMGDPFDTEDGRTVTVSDPAVHPSVVSVEFVSSTHYYERVADAGDGQYVAFDVAAEGVDLGEGGREQYGEPIDVPLAVSVDGDRYAAPIPVGRDGEPDTDRVAIPVPVTDADDAAVVWARDDGPQPRWPLGGTLVDDIAAAPAFELRSWSVPDRVERGTAFDVSVTVANVGERDGRFLATLGVEQGSLGVPERSVAVRAGETRRHTVTIDPEAHEADDLRVVLDWAGGRRTATVEVAGSTDG